MVEDGEKEDSEQVITTEDSNQKQGAQVE